MGKATRRRITITGNWRSGGPDNELAGSGTVDKDGSIECAASLADADWAYCEIEEHIADGHTDGTVVCWDDEQERYITYHWQIEAPL